MKIKSVRLKLVFLKMPLTRSATSRSKVQKSLEDKQNEEATGEEEKEEMSCPLPKTVKDIGSDNESHLNTKTAVLLLVMIFASSAAALAFVYCSFPHLDPYVYRIYIRSYISQIALDHTSHKKVVNLIYKSHSHSFSSRAMCFRSMTR